MAQTAIKPRRILCPVDTSECSRAAFRQAVAFAESATVEVVVLCVYWQHRYIPPELQSWGEAGSQQLLELAEKEARVGVDALLENVDRDVAKRIRVLLTSGDPATTIVETAERERVDVIVMGTHGRSGLSRLFDGSVAERVVRTAPCPVLTLRVPDTSAAA